MCALAVYGSPTCLFICTAPVDTWQCRLAAWASVDASGASAWLSNSGSVSAGYQRLDYAAGVLLKDNKTLTVAYAHNVDATLAAGAEITKQLEEKEGTSFTLG